MGQEISVRDDRSFHSHNRDVLISKLLGKIVKKDQMIARYEAKLTNYYRENLTLLDVMRSRSFQRESKCDDTLKMLMMQKIDRLEHKLNTLSVESKTLQPPPPSLNLSPSFPSHNLSARDTKSNINRRIVYNRHVSRMRTFSDSPTTNLPFSESYS